MLHPWRAILVCLQCHSVGTRLLCGGKVGGGGETPLILVELLDLRLLLLTTRQPENGCPIYALMESIQPLPSGTESIQPLPSCTESMQPLPSRTESIQPLPSGTESIQPLPSGKESIQPLPRGVESMKSLPFGVEWIMIPLPFGTTSVNHHLAV